MVESMHRSSFVTWLQFTEVKSQRHGDTVGATHRASGAYTCAKRSRAFMRPVSRAITKQKNGWGHAGFTEVRWQGPPSREFGRNRQPRPDSGLDLSHFQYEGPRTLLRCSPLARQGSEEVDSGGTHVKPYDRFQAMREYLDIG